MRRDGSPGGVKNTFRKKISQKLALENITKHPRNISNSFVGKPRGSDPELDHFVVQTLVRWAKSVIFVGVLKNTLNFTFNRTRKIG